MFTMGKGSNFSLSVCAWVPGSGRQSICFSRCFIGRFGRSPIPIIPKMMSDRQSNLTGSRARLLRGSPWGFDLDFARCACRDKFDADGGYLNLGFRSGSPI